MTLKQLNLVFEFIKNLETAFYYRRIPASSQVIVLKRLVKEDAKYAVCESKTIDENFKYLKTLFGNPRAIWKKEKDEFLKMLEKESKNWASLFSPQRKLLLVTVSNFLMKAKSLAHEFESLKDEIFSISTVNLMFEIFPDIFD